MTWTTHCIAACLLLVSVLPLWGADLCSLCHGREVRVTGAHRAVTCRECHQAAGRPLVRPDDRQHGSAGCVACHRNYQSIYLHPMATRAKEQGFVERSYGRKDRAFEQKNCAGCHLQGCGDCHGSGHNLTRPSSDNCATCHKGYYVGWDYLGRAPRENHVRYQRGKEIEGETFLTMRPDVHRQRGMSCGSCHTMQSMLQGKTVAKGCRDCHSPSRSVPEHRIAAHLERMTCTACHAAWGAQEYGTFYLRFADGNVPEPFDQLTVLTSGYVYSAYLKRQDLPPLGVDLSGRIAPIRPQFIAYYGNYAGKRPLELENQLLAAEWRVFTPHTIQRGVPLCDACHDNPRRFLLEPPAQRIYDLRKDGMGLDSFWSRTGQRVSNGSFIDERRYRALATKTPAYQRAYVDKWKRFVKPDAAVSPR